MDIVNKKDITSEINSMFVPFLTSPSAISNATALEPKMSNILDEFAMVFANPKRPNASNATL